MFVEATDLEASMIKFQESFKVSRLTFSLQMKVAWRTLEPLADSEQVQGMQQSRRLKEE